MEPEYITIVEGPTPEFRPNMEAMFQSVLESPSGGAVATCELRTGNGDDIRLRCLQAWSEKRPVRLDFPDDIRMREEVDVIAMRLFEVDAGTVLKLWVRWPLDEIDFEDDEDDEDDEDLDEDMLDDFSA